MKFQLPWLLQYNSFVTFHILSLSVNLIVNNWCQLVILLCSGVALENQPDVMELPVAVSHGTFKPVVPSSQLPPTFIMFDLETTDLSKFCLTVKQNIFQHSHSNSRTWYFIDQLNVKCNYVNSSILICSKRISRSRNMGAIQ